MLREVHVLVPFYESLPCLASFLPRHEAGKGIAQRQSISGENKGRPALCPWFAACAWSLSLASIAYVMGLSWCYFLGP